jgi:peptide-methionine (S)-S-oxide reductase
MAGATSSIRLLGAVIAVAATTMAAPVDAEELATATFAGGCFWCVESDFDAIPGVKETVSGYTGGELDNPTYKQVSAGGTGHREAVEITYDPAVVTYEELLTAFWHSVDPTDDGGQFCDRGKSYETAIFVHDEDQRAAAEASKRAAEEELGREVVTPIETAGAFFPAEDYHQGYYEKNPLRYKYYRWSCGRDQRIEQVWGDGAFKGIPKHS